MFLLVYQKAFFAFSIQSSSLMPPLSLSLSLHPSWSIPGASLQQAACAQEAVFPMGLQVKNQDSLSACEGRHLSPQLRLWGPSPHHPPLPHPRPSPSLHPSIPPSLPPLSLTSCQPSRAHYPGMQFPSSLLYSSDLLF